MEKRPLTFKNFVIASSGVLILWLPVLWFHLVLILFAALITYAVVEVMARYLRRLSQHYVGFSVFLVMMTFLLAILLFTGWVENRTDNLNAGKLMSSVADILDQLRTKLPNSMAIHIPEGVSSLQTHISLWLKEHAKELQTAGLHTLRSIGHIVGGVVLGAIAAFQTLSHQQSEKELPRLLHAHFQELLNGFTNVFFAQVWISLINTILTAIYLLIILPSIGKALALAGTLVLVTFLAGLIPVVGNLISNTLIVVMSLGDSMGVAIASLLFLIAVHKLEYFLNAEIIGQKINARAWELLTVMILMESAFGIAGLVSAPVVYAQIKRLLARQGWL